MTRVKEPPAGTTQVPDYKSPPSRIVRSLRKGYDNLREKVAKKSDGLMAVRGKLRDMEESRELWKKRAKEAEAEIDNMRRENEHLQTELKKRLSP